MVLPAASPPVRAASNVSCCWPAEPALERSHAGSRVPGWYSCPGCSATYSWWEINGYLWHWARLHLVLTDDAQTRMAVRSLERCLAQSMQLYQGANRFVTPSVAEVNAEQCHTFSSYEITHTCIIIESRLSKENFDFREQQWNRCMLYMSINLNVF